MRKTTKGALAIGAGVALLLGGAGTLAAWQVQASSAAQTVTAGDLNVATGTGQWYWGSATINTTTNAVTCTAADTSKSIANIANVRIVPGDCVVLVTPVTITAIGDHLTATLTAAGSALTTTPSGSESNFTLTSSVAPVSGATGLTASGGNINVTPTGTPAAPNANITSVVIFKGETTARNGATVAVGVPAVTATLKQTAPAVAP
ncbi:alternate-type signal peptide domain-containing protein [Cellulomonas sp. HZM]|uniref:alternate-type signal peptide domain-containing protein n=1 Tax=Cellulomonas sp. HZM TaxID=1454010 RepID=UPI000689565C|nr:alternate-type signal peptide domain-containing protein [Cellulomonas sp. HZM]